MRYPTTKHPIAIVCQARPRSMPITRACTGGACSGLIAAVNLMLFGATLPQIAGTLVVVPLTFAALTLMGR
jgi:hypothetical protein